MHEGSSNVSHAVRQAQCAPQPAVGVGRSPRGHHGSDHRNPGETERPDEARQPVNVRARVLVASQPPEQGSEAEHAQRGGAESPRDRPRKIVSHAHRAAPAVRSGVRIQTAIRPGATVAVTVVHSPSVIWSRSTCVRSRAAKASTASAASYRARSNRRSTASCSRRRAGLNTAATPSVEPATASVELPVNGSSNGRSNPTTRRYTPTSSALSSPYETVRLTI